MKDSILKLKNVQIISKELQKEIKGGDGNGNRCLQNPPDCWLK
ncbi:MAG: hypothetical protein QM535_10180 [Limnohabitans sp.]|nr:hypothetical protein [Limnohabitans sp.]